MRRKLCVALGLAFVLLLPEVALAGDTQNVISVTVANHVLYQRSHGTDKFFVAKIDSGTELKVVLAHDKLDGQRETVQSMCRRYHCVAGVNGDFYSAKRHGGIISKGHILRTSDPSGSEARLGQDVSFVSNPTENLVAVSALGKTVFLGMNLAPAVTLPSVYTSVFGAPVGVLQRGVIATYQCSCHQIPDKAGKEYTLSLVRQQFTGTMSPLKYNQMAIRLTGVDAAWFAKVHPRRIEIKLPPAASVEVIGAHPVILHGGIINSSLVNFFATSLHPRTVLGSNPEGRVWLIAIDSRVSLPRAAQIARNLGATEAINLDGGGSTTFVVHGRTLNNPADKAERAVASAVLVVEKTAKKVFITKKSINKVTTTSTGKIERRYSKPRINPGSQPVVIQLRPAIATLKPSSSIPEWLAKLAFFLIMILGMIHYRLWRSQLPPE